MSSERRRLEGDTFIGIRAPVGTREIPVVLADGVQRRPSHVKNAAEVERNQSIVQNPSDRSDSMRIIEASASRAAGRHLVTQKPHSSKPLLPATNELRQRYCDHQRPAIEGILDEQAYPEYRQIGNPSDHRRSPRLPGSPTECSRRESRIGASPRAPVPRTAGGDPVPCKITRTKSPCTARAYGRSLATCRTNE